MKSYGYKNLNVDIATLGLSDTTIYWNLSPAALIEHTISSGQGELASSGALKVNTGQFTGRSPKDRYIVEDKITSKTVDWGTVNQPITTAQYDKLYKQVINHLNNRVQIYARDAYACASLNYRLNVRVYSEQPWQSLFVNNMFLRPTKKEVSTIDPDWQVFVASGLEVDHKEMGLRQKNFAIINFTEKKIIIGGTAYTGEIKKGIFSVLNFILPTEHDVLSMHCSANVGKKGDTALFFGLSGTGKTTLSTDSERKLIGDDEHGWASSSVFNFEGGRYAKTINLSESKEPQIYKAIKFGAMLENVGFHDRANRLVDFVDSSITQNTRVSYPIHHIDNIVYNSRGEIPENVFFLTCDAFGVLPPISKLTTPQAMYHFLSGYTAKIAGTEAGINEPEATFSACFGLPFLPLKPTVYAELLGKKIENGQKRINKTINVWLVNTGWTGGAFGQGTRMELSYTRAMIRAALSGNLDEVDYETEPFFGLTVPKSCPDVPNALLLPRDTWPNEEEYDTQAKKLVDLFKDNFKQYESYASAEILEVMD